MVDLIGRSIAITGASSGIGMAAALACARAGMNIAVGARREGKLRALVERINADHDAGISRGRAIAVRMNVDDPADCHRLIDQTVEAFGTIYAVVANAGYGLERAIHETSDEDLRAIFETNFFGTMNTIRPALGRMLAPGTGDAALGHIIIVSSCLSKLGTPYNGAYSATKAAQDHIARAMRLELAGSGICISSIHPIGTRTELFQVMDRRSGGSASLHTPEFFMQSPERVARAVVAVLRRPRGLFGGWGGGWGGGQAAGGGGREVWTSTGVRLLTALGTAFPQLADQLLRAHVVRRQRHYRPADAGD